MHSLVNTLGKQGQLEEAAAIMKEVREERRRILGEKHPHTIFAMTNFAAVLYSLGALYSAQRDSSRGKETKLRDGTRSRKTHHLDYSPCSELPL